LKRECIKGQIFATRAEVRRAIFSWINWYNTKRLHSSLKYTTPTTWEQAQQAA
jgi:putative transposase